jgi:formate dehydrogenase iron-sulfur subunit
MTWNNMAILTDVTKCIGCEECVKACQETRGLPKEQLWRWVNRIDDLSSARWTTLVRTVDEGGRHFIRRQCRHCLDPECVSVCIVGALQKTEEGPVIYDRDVCIGCRYCMIACPWEIPRYSWEDTVPYIQKCDMCYERVISEGKVPACVEACPTEATIFGERDELLVEAKRRLAAEPDKYIQKVWGEEEVGGTSVMYISNVELNLTDLDQPIRDTAPMPHRTTKILHQMPLVFVLMAGAMGGINWVIRRRQQIAAEACASAEESNGKIVDETSGIRNARREQRP